MAAMRFGLVTSAVRICPSTIRRRASAASNMRETPHCRTGLCDTPRQNASESRFLFRNRGQAPLSPLTAVPLIYVRKALPKQIGAVTHAGTATWRSGYAAVCKAAYGRITTLCLVPLRLKIRGFSLNHPHRCRTLCRLVLGGSVAIWVAKIRHARTPLPAAWSVEKQPTEARHPSATSHPSLKLRIALKSRRL